MPDINALAVILGIAVLVVGPGGSVYVGLRVALRAERELREMATRDLKRSAERIENGLTDVVQELRTLNSRVNRTEAHIEGLERRERG